MRIVQAELPARRCRESYTLLKRSLLCSAAVIIRIARTELTERHCRESCVLRERSLLSGVAVNHAYCAIGTSYVALP